MLLAIALAMMSLSAGMPVFDQSMSAEAVSKHASLQSASVRTSDYPKSARRADEEGRTKIQYIVGANGHVSECTVKQSSGSAALDQASCQIVSSRFRFKPALNDKEEAVPEIWEQSILWRLPRDIVLEALSPVNRTVDCPSCIG